jgi:hypothetical protein
MANRNGLLAPQATHGTPQESYYLRKGEPIVEPLVIEAQDNSTQAVLYVDPAAAGAYMGALNLTPGGNAISGTAAAGITIRTGTGARTIAEVGTNSVANNLLYIAGTSGVGQVYDEVYNQPINTTAVASSTGSLPTAGGFGFNYTPDRTGAYMLQVNINVRNADGIPLDGFIEWVLSDGAEVQYASSTINSNQMIKVVGMNEINGVAGGIAEPTDFSISNLCFLTAGVPVLFSITTARNSTVGGVAWAIQNYDARLIQMC